MKCLTKRTIRPNAKIKKFLSFYIQRWLVIFVEYSNTAGTLKAKRPFVCQEKPN